VSVAGDMAAALAVDALADVFAAGQRRSCHETVTYALARPFRNRHHFRQAPVTCRKATRLEIEAAVIAELRRVTDVLSVTVNPVVGRATTWNLTTFNPGRADGERCAETLREIVARLQAELDFAQDPVCPMPRRL
jgi:hypothetical protein